MIPFDRKLAAALKAMAKPGVQASEQQQARKTLDEICARLLDPAFKQTLDASFRAVGSFPDHANRRPSSECLSLVQALNARGLPATAEVLFTACFDSLKALDVDSLFRSAPTVKCVEIVLRATRTKKKEFGDKLVSAPEPAYVTAALDWCLEKGEPRHGAALLPRLLANLPRPEHLRQWEEVVADAFQKPKAHLLLHAFLQQDSTDSHHLKAMTGLLLKDNSLLRSIADMLPDLLATNKCPKALQFINLILEHILIAPLEQKPVHSAAIAHLATNLLIQEDLSTDQQNALAAIEQATARLRFSTTNTEVLARIWVLERLKAASERPDDNQHLTTTGARHMAVAFEKARQGFNAHAVLSMTAKNLGMTAIGTKGERVAYNPLQHEDTQGGIMPGEIVEITEPGWTFRKSVVLRALAFRPTGSTSPSSP